MEYTVNGLARLAGVSVRTLHWYDEIGLLRPARVTEAGYRMYGPDEVDALQSPICVPFHLETNRRDDWKC